MSRSGARGPLLIPPGWERWFAVCKMGGYFRNSYNDDGAEVELGASPEEYMTSVIGNRTVEWLDAVGRGAEPFFALVAPHAPHISDAVYPYITEAAPWSVSFSDCASAQICRPDTPKWCRITAD